MRHLNLQGLFGLAEEVPAGLTRVEYRIVLDSPEPEDRLRDLVEGVEGRCPVLDILTRPVEVTGEVVFRREEQHGKG